MSKIFEGIVSVIQIIQDSENGRITPEEKTARMKALSEELRAEKERKQKRAEYKKWANEKWNARQ